MDGVGYDTQLGESVALLLMMSPSTNDYTPKSDFDGPLVTRKVLRVTNSVFGVY